MRGWPAGEGWGGGRARAGAPPRRPRDEGNVGVAAQRRRLQGLRPTAGVERQAGERSGVRRRVRIAGQAPEGDGCAAVAEPPAEGGGDGGLAAERFGGGDQDSGHSLVNYSKSASYG